ncbi:MAG: DHH family phosphoesterase [Nitrososphaerales archaeon]
MVVGYKGFTMPDEQGILLKVQQFAEKIASSARKNENILLVAHHDADGICSAAILAEYIRGLRGHCEVKCVSEPTIRLLEKLAAGTYEMTIFLDLASGMSEEISRLLGDRWLGIDHHEIPDSEMISERILNPWQFEYDGSKEIGTAGLCYFLIGKSSTPQSAFLAIAGALADGEDVGPRRSLVGLNAKILDTDPFKEVTSKIDLMLFGRETRPAHESLANTVSCFIPGLTSNKDACLASLRGAGVDLKAGSRWRTVSDFSQDEKQQVLSAILPHLAGTTNTVEDLVGTIYTMSSQDEYSHMHDARDLASILSACGRMGKPGIGIILCVGDGGETPSEAERVFSDYRTDLVRMVQTLMSSADRALDGGSYSLVVGDGIVSERMTGAACEVFATLNRSKSKVVFLRTTTQDGDVKVSARLGREARECNLGSMLREIARSSSGVGGGHQGRAGARFSIIKQQEFQAAVDTQFRAQRSS